MPRGEARGENQEHLSGFFLLLFSCIKLFVRGAIQK